MLHRYTDESESRWRRRTLVTGGVAGAVTLALQDDLPVGLTVHSPVDPGGDWQEHDGCPWLEMPCWFRSTWSGEHRDLDGVLSQFYRVPGADGFWSLMEDLYVISLEVNR